MKILYLSCHSILEYDEIQLFSELGADVFSYGTYRDPRNIDDPKRPVLNLAFHEDLYNLTKVDDKLNIPQEVIDWADTIIVMHRADWIWANWEKMKGKRVILRTIGQNNLERENEIRPLKMQGLQVVRYSPRESTIPGFCGKDALIRFYKDPEELKGWTGQYGAVLTVAQDMVVRENFCNYSFFQRATCGLNRVLIGKGSEAVGPWGKGIVSYEHMKDYYRRCRVYFYTGTYPAGYTLNFIEAAMTGMPIVALGPLWGNSPVEIGQQTYEVADWSDDGRVIQIADDVATANAHCIKLLEDSAYASQQSIAVRKLAVRLFGKETIKEQWRKFLFGA